MEKNVSRLYTRAIAGVSRYLRFIYRERHLLFLPPVLGGMFGTYSNKYLGVAAHAKNGITFQGKGSMIQVLTQTIEYTLGPERQLMLPTE